jgi:pSer/pThr/pTyr-binding forkhead associated (FHA) protein
MDDPNRTQLGSAPVADPNRTVMGGAPSLNATVTIKPVQCPVCKAFNPPGIAWCNDCGLIFDKSLDGDAFGAPAVRLPVLLEAGGRGHALRPGPNVVGRAGDVALDDPRVSRRHAEVALLQDGRVTVRDLGSTNGTKLGGEPLGADPVEIADGASLSFGGLELTLSLPGESERTVQPLSGRTVSVPVAPSVGRPVAFLDFDGRSEPLTPGKKVFGRRAECDIVIADPYVSGRHGVFEVGEDGVFLTDTGSTNGTVLNEAKLPPDTRTRLAEGDVVKLGGVEITVRFAAGD